MVVVDILGCGDYLSISAALKALKDNPHFVREIYIKKGFYKEHVEIDIEGLVIRGEDVFETIISDNHYALEYMEDIGKRGTFRSYTMLVDANNVAISNLTIENSSGSGDQIKQAIALYANGDHFKAFNLRLLGHQDTLFTGPLPPFEMEPNGFIGPKHLSERVLTHQYYKDCYIRGDIDFIFGSATCVFENCEMFSCDINKAINGYVCAPSTYQEQPYGYVFKNCNFTSECPANSVYLGRPWRHYAKAIMLNCTYGNHIIEAGFDDWQKVEAHNTIYFGEYLVDNPYKRADFVKKLNLKDLDDYINDKVLQGNWWKA